MAPRPRGQADHDAGGDGLLGDLVSEIQEARRDLAEIRRQHGGPPLPPPGGGENGKSMRQLVTTLLVLLVAFLAGFVLNGKVESAIFDKRLDDIEARLERAGIY